MTNKPFAITVASAALVALSGCAALNSQSADSKSAQELRMEATETRLLNLERRLQAQGKVDLYADIQALQSRERQLQGEIERLSYELQQLQRQQQSAYLDIDNRLRNLENRTQPAAIPSGASSAPAQLSASGAATASANDTATYGQAFELLKTGNYDQAAGAFEAFLQQNPQDDLAPNAQYWLGESHYVSQRFDKAEQAFRAVIAVYPQSSKVRDAMLKLGYSLHAQGKKSEARNTLNQVIQLYPGTTQANLAQQKLNTL